MGCGVGGRRMTNHRSQSAVLLLLSVGFWPGAAEGQAREGGLRALLAQRSGRVNVGSPVLVDFLIQNASDEPVTLLVPGAEPDTTIGALGLPLSHVFSGENGSVLTIAGDGAAKLGVTADLAPSVRAPVVALAPRATLGTTLNLLDYCPSLRNSGTYHVRWAPYGGTVESNSLTVEVAPLKQAEVVTDLGKMSVRFFYDEAPRHVENFIELGKKGFYNNLSFHRIEPGYCVQGGCPNGDGTGIRRDGLKLAGEFTSKPIDRGSVCMARLEDDPDSASCQFFIAYTRIPEWDGRYTVFGELQGNASLETLEKLMASPLDEGGKPQKKLYLRSVRIVDAPREVK